MRKASRTLTLRSSWTLCSLAFSFVSSDRIIIGAKTVAYTWASCDFLSGKVLTSVVVEETGVIDTPEFVLRRVSEFKKEPLVLTGSKDVMLVIDTSDIALADVDDLDLPADVADCWSITESAVTSLISL